jgi:hypothetical protein
MRVATFSGPVQRSIIFCRDLHDAMPRTGSSWQMVDSFSTSLSHFLSHYLVAYVCRSYATGRTGVHSLLTDFASYKSVNPDFKKKGSPILSLAQVPPNGFPRLLRIFTKMGPCHRNGSKQRAWIHVSTINRLFFVPLVDAGGPFSFLS